MPQTLPDCNDPIDPAGASPPRRGRMAHGGRAWTAAVVRWVLLAAGLTLAVAACSPPGGTTRRASQLAAAPTAVAAPLVSSASPAPASPPLAPTAKATVPAPTATPPATPTAPAEPTRTSGPVASSQSEQHPTSADGGAAATEGTVAKPSGPSAPDFAVRTLDGRTFSLAEQRGKTVVMLFTASGCGDCITELQALARVHKEYGRRGVEILALSVDPLDDAETFLLMKRAAGPGADYHWALDAKNAVTRAYDVKALETTVIVDPAGRIAYRDQVSTTFPMFKRELDKILG